LQKIVIVTGKSTVDENLIACLKTLFPECEIQIFPSRSETLQHTSGVRGSLRLACQEEV